MPRRSVETEEDWERVLHAALRLQTVVEGAIYRFSYDDDHVVAELRERYDEVLASLEAVAGWKSARLKRPVQILGSLDGIDTGIRQLRRTRPLDTELVAAAGGLARVPTLPEMLRIKSWLVVTRNATRDYVDTAALAARLDSANEDAASQSLAPLDELYPQENGESVLRQLAKQLAEPLPYDFERGAFEELRGLMAPWDSWDFVEASLRELAARIEIRRAG
jgi:hypothetical protein